MLVPQPLAVVMPSSSEPHGWNTETLKTPLGDFEFKNGFPVGDTEERLRQLLTLNRATEVYLAQLMPASEVALREGLRASARPSYSGRPLGRSDGCQDDAADRQHREVYGLSHLALQSDGPTVVEAPPPMRVRRSSLTTR